MLPFCRLPGLRRAKAVPLILGVRILEDVKITPDARIVRMGSGRQTNYQRFAKNSRRFKTFILQVPLVLVAHFAVLYITNVWEGAERVTTWRAKPSILMGLMPKKRP